MKILCERHNELHDIKADDLSRIVKCLTVELLAEQISFGWESRAERMDDRLAGRPMVECLLDVLAKCSDEGAEYTTHVDILMAVEAGEKHRVRVQR